MNKIKKSAIVAAMAVPMALAMSVTLPGCSIFRGQSSASEYADDVAITAKVKKELLDSKRVDGLDVNVDSTNGNVTLSGWASSSAEAQTAASIARGVRGVKSVNNQLKVKEG